MFYIDTSAVAKLVLHEDASHMFQAWFSKNQKKVVSSDLLRTELIRAVRRLGLAYVPRARSVLEAITLVETSASVFERAAFLDSPMLRSLDALHLASALEFGDELQAFVTYDLRLGEAALQNGMHVLSPGVLR
jgi:uncharacterized protein